MKTILNIACACTLTLAFLACDNGSGGKEPGGSSGNGGTGGFLGGNGNIANLPTNASNNQIYMDGVEYNGNGNIKLILKAGSVRDTFPAGTILNGKITWNLPENIDSKYLSPPFSKCQEDGYYCEQDFFPNNVSTIEPTLRVEISGKDLCTLNDKPRILNSSGQQIGGAELDYFSAFGTYKGVLVRLPDGDRDEKATNYDITISKGWYLLYAGSNGNTVSANPNIVSGIANGSLMWRLSCPN